MDKQYSRFEMGARPPLRNQNNCLIGREKKDSSPTRPAPSPRKRPVQAHRELTL